MPDSYSTRQAHIDFEQWSSLAALDPEAFEARRHQLIEDVIRSAPQHRQPRLRGLQWRLDRVRERSGTPLAACIRMSEMMWEALLGEGGLRDSLECLTQARPQPPRRPSAQVFQLDAVRRHHPR
jgi:hypothetical protein